MHPEHRIDEFTLDLSFTTTRLARREKAGLINWLREDLLPALDKLFSHYSPGNQVLRFETLEFDLGRLDARHYQQQIRAQLLEQFTHLLKSQMLALDPRTLAKVPLMPLVPDARAALQQLIAYLTTGNITAHYAFNPAGRYGDEKSQPYYREKIHHQLFEQVIAQQDIAELLRQVAARELLTARLVKQFSTAQRLVLLRQLAPQQLSQVQALLDLIEFASTPTALQQQLWQQVLLLALESPHASAAVWLVRLLDKLATSLAMSKMQLREFLLAIPLPAAQAHPLAQLQTRIGQLIQTADLHTRTQSHNTTETSNLVADNTDSYVNTGKPLNYSLFLRKQEPLDQRTSPRSLMFMDTRVREYDKKCIFQSFLSNAGVYAKQNSTAYLPAGNSPVELLPEDVTNIPRTLLQQKIAQALVRADINSLQAIWPTLTAREPELLFAALQHYLLQPEIRQQLMLQLPLPMQVDIIGILAADIKPLFLRLQEVADELVNAMSTQAGNENNFTYIDSALINGAEKINSESPTHLQRRLWEIAVGLLLNHSPATASAANTTNPDIFLHQLIEHYAHIGSLNAQWLQQLWRQAIQPITFEPTITHQQSVASQSNEARISNQQIISTASPKNLSIRPQPENTLPHSTSPHTDLDNISDHQLFDLCLRLKSGAVSWSQISFDVTLLQRMIDSYIRLGHSATAENCRDFIAAINHQATTHAPAEFYRAVLQALVADRLVDLEAISAAIEKPPQPINTINTGKTDSIQTSAANTAITTEVVRVDSVNAQVQTPNNQFSATGSADNAHALSLAKSAVVPVNIAAIADSLIADTQPQKQLLDLELFAHTSNDNTQNHSLELTTSTSTNLTTDLPMATNPLTTAVSISSRRNIHGGDKDVPTAHTHVQSLLATTQAVEHLQQLHLSNDQWQEICSELILHQTTMDTAVDLLQAIKTFAQQALNTAGYYRKVVRALLQQQALDLELFATFSGDNAQMHFNEVDNIATTTADLQTTQTPTIDIHTTMNNQAAADSSLQSGHNTNELQNTQSPAISLTTNTNTSLLTGSNDSLRKPAISLAQLLSVETAFAREQLLALQQHINFLLQHTTTDIVNQWLELLREVKHHSRLIREVPAHLLHQIVMRLQPATYPPLDALVKVVNEAIALLAVDSSSLALKQAKWEFIFHTLFVVRPAALDKNQHTETLCRIFAAAVGIDDVQRLLNLAERRVALLTPPARQQPAMRLQDLQGAQKNVANTYAWEAGIPINNAGQVLAAAFMPRLFAMLELTQEGKFVHPAAADRAAHLVQFMVSGATHTPEYELTLNKMLCGISTSLPISDGIEISAQEKNIIEQMLTSMIQHWKVLGSTSIAGLRETFFQRQGWLVLEEDCWRLKVQERTFDMLLDRLPWSISLIKHSWMDKPLRVSWRDQS